jgi:SAM-dependent methyltransferase
LVLDQYEFLDFGCSDGGSLQFIARSFPGKRGLGIDICPRKVARAQQAGFEAICMDVGQLQNTPNCVSFVIMSHFMEHLPNFEIAAKCMKSALVAAKDFVIVRQPWFDSDGYLFRAGLKFYWSDWTGHTFKVTCTDLARMVRTSGVQCRYQIYGRLPVETSSAAVVHPLDSPPDQHSYDPRKHGTKNLTLNFSPRNSVFCESLLVAIKSQRYSFRDIQRLLPGELLLDATNPAMKLPSPM